MRYSIAYQVKLEIDVVILKLTEEYFKNLANRLGSQVMAGASSNHLIEFVDGSRLGLNKLGRVYAE